MLFILEGPDGAGKTTYKNILKEQFPKAFDYHFSAPQPGDDQLDIYSTVLMQHKPEHVLIFDRSWYSDRIYGPIVRHKMELPLTHVRALEALVKQHGGGIVFYLTANTRTLWSRCQKRGETYITSFEMLDEISKEYDKVMEQEVGLPMFKVNTGR